MNDYTDSLIHNRNVAFRVSESSLSVATAAMKELQAAHRRIDYLRESLVMLADHMPKCDCMDARELALAAVADDNKRAGGNAT